MMIITAEQHSQRHSPPADSANPTHGSRVDSSIRKACMSERIRIRPFIERWLFSWCPAKMHMVFGLPDAMHHIFVKRSREMQALETECEIWHEPEMLPQQEHQRGYVSHCFLAWCSLFSQAALQAGTCLWEKATFSLFLWNRQQCCSTFGVFLTDWPMQWRNKTPSPFLLQGSDRAYPQAMERMQCRGLKAWGHLGASICVQRFHLPSNQWQEEI